MVAKGETGDVEIGRPTFVADLANIATGWLRFREGQAPERVIDPSWSGRPHAPMRASSAASCSRSTARSSSADSPSCPAPRSTWATRSASCTPTSSASAPATLARSRDRLHRLRADEGPLRGQLQALLELVKWVDRPAELPDASPVEPSEIWQGAPATARPPAIHVPPPQPAPADDLAQAEF